MRNQRRDHIEMLIHQCKRDRDHIQHGLQTSFDEFLVDQLDARIKELESQLSHIEAAMRVGKVLEND